MYLKTTLVLRNDGKQTEAKAFWAALFLYCTAELTSRSIVAQHLKDKSNIVTF